MFIKQQYLRLLPLLLAFSLVFSSSIISINIVSAETPVLHTNIPNFILFPNTLATAYDLTDYFSDPDGDELTFSYEHVIPKYNISVAYADIEVIIDKNTISYYPITNTSGHSYFIFIASDSITDVKSNIVKVDIEGLAPKHYTPTVTRERCGDTICSITENCSNCPSDCGKCNVIDKIPGCSPNWNCSEWSPCLPMGLAIRNCIDLSNCNDNRTMPNQSMECYYDANCNDGVMNGIEEDIDCGGPCKACPTCNDGMKNQGELGIDCEGPCEKICETCIDNIKNQDETDVDCGGGFCNKCRAGLMCINNLDCISLNCVNSICSAASCKDGIKNQNEEKIDCGGVCEICATCDDNEKNGGEKLVDCGGPCKACVFKDKLRAYWSIWLLTIIIIGTFLYGLVKFIILIFFHPEKLRCLYDSKICFNAIINLNKLVRIIKYKIKGKKELMSKEVADQYNNELNDIINETDENGKILYSAVVKIYKEIFGLEDSYEDSAFYAKAKVSGLPYFLRILFIGFYNKSKMLQLNTFITNEEKEKFVNELKLLLSEMSK